MTEHKRGLFITLEGGEGVGKSTNIATIVECLQRHSIDFISTREPGGTTLSEQIRELLLSKRADTMDPTAELLLVFAARAQHINTVIKPALSRGSWVLCDRFTDATYAYQGSGRGLNMEHIQALELLVQQGLQPDHTILLDIDPAVGMQRAAQRGELDRFESESGAFFDKVRAGYLHRAQADATRFRIVDAARSLAEVQQEVDTLIADIIEEHTP